jgi:hypothetical protein
MLAIFYIVITPLQDTRGVPKVGLGPLTSGDRGSDMIPTCRCGCRRAAPLAAAEPAEDAVRPDSQVREQPCHTADA